MKQRLITLLIYSVALFIIVNISRSIYSLWQKQYILGEQAQVKKLLEEENKELSEALSQAQSPEFVEKQAREKLNLKRPGETVVLLPKELKQVEEQAQAQIEADLPNWRKWWKLFF